MKNAIAAITSYAELGRSLRSMKALLLGLLRLRNTQPHESPRVGIPAEAKPVGESSDAAGRLSQRPSRTTLYRSGASLQATTAVAVLGTRKRSQVRVLDRPHKACGLVSPVDLAGASHESHSVQGEDVARGLAQSEAASAGA